MKRKTVESAGQETEKVIGSGEKLTIETTADFAERIRNGLAEAKTVAIEFEPEVQLDVTALQLFCSACMTATAEGKNFIYRGSLPKALLDLAAAAGVEKHGYCKNNNPSCFYQFAGGSTWKSCL
jgi:hypothetical protein